MGFSAKIANYTRIYKKIMRQLPIIIGKIITDRQFYQL